PYRRSSPTVRLSFPRPRAPRPLLSFPTRRSSDLCCAVPLSGMTAPETQRLLLDDSDAKVLLCSDDGRASLAGVEAALAKLVPGRSEEHTSELQSLTNIVCRLLLEKKKRPRLPQSPAMITPTPFGIQLLANSMRHRHADG